MNGYDGCLASQNKNERCIFIMLQDLRQPKL